MNYLMVIIFVSIVVSSLVLINGSIDNQQELSQINNMVQQKNTEIVVETLSIQGYNTDGIISLSNLSNEPINVIQIRVYEDGNFVESFEVNEIIHGNTELQLEHLPIVLQEMLLQ